jgi:hypothetical protein
MTYHSPSAQVPMSLPLRYNRFHECIKKCHVCPKWGANHNGRVGCLILEESGVCCCRIDAHILNGGGCLDTANPQFDACEVKREPRRAKRNAEAPSTPWQPGPYPIVNALHELARTNGHPQATCTLPPAVTSLSLLDHHLSRQTDCLDSWVRAGLQIISVNASDEIERLTQVYPQVSQWIVSDERSEGYDRQTQRITSLTDVTIQLDRQILLINSDIEIVGSPLILSSAIASGDAVIGIRHNYRRKHRDAIREPYGLDAFTFTPDQARSLPRLGFAIGRPMWDYWIPIHFASIGQRMTVIGEPFFYHLAHTPFWNHREWKMGETWVIENYGAICTSQMRKAMPYPPK